MAMVARYHGHDVDLNGMRQRFFPVAHRSDASQPDGLR
jgi:hypothetical protein